MLKLNYICLDDWNCPVYRDQFGKLWKDINLGKGEPALHRSSNNELDGEPNIQLTQNMSLSQNMKKMSNEKIDQELLDVQNGKINVDELPSLIYQEYRSRLLSNGHDEYCDQ